MFNWSSLYYKTVFAFANAASKPLTSEPPAVAKKGCPPPPPLMALANSLIVGRDDQSDLYEWVCKACEPSNKPLHAHII